MKTILFFTAVILVSMNLSATEQCSQKNSSLLFGQVGKLVFNAVKRAGAIAKCDDRICTFLIADFATSIETDGCGGGTTGYATSFTYADGKKFEFSHCTQEGAPEVEPKHLGKGLSQVLSELGLSQTVGWTSSIRLSKIECVTNAKIGSTEGAFANCTLTNAAIKSTN